MRVRHNPGGTKWQQNDKDTMMLERSIALLETSFQWLQGAKRTHRNAMDAWIRPIGGGDLNSGFGGHLDLGRVCSANSCARDLSAPGELTSSPAQPARQDLAERAAFFAVILT